MEPEVVAGRFTLLAKVGQGGVGTIHRALDRESGSLVALKLLLASSDEDQKRFAEEARALRGLHHPGIVRYVADGVDERRPYLAMEWLEGEDLETRLRRGPIGPEDTLVIARAAAAALAFLHERGVVHRDIKPANLFVPGGRLADLKLVDFGLARGARAQKITATGFAVGTPGYMAPEHLRGEKVDARADMFALGGVLYHCLSGQPPFGRGSAIAVISRVVLEEPTPIAEAAPGTPPVLADIVTRLLSKDRSTRLADGAALAAELADLDAARPSTRYVGKRQPSFGAVLHVAWPAREAEASLDSTLDVGLSARLVRAATGAGARVEVTLAHGFVATFPREESLEAQAIGAARCALATAALSADVSVAVAMERGDGSRDRAMEEASSSPTRSGVRIDSVTASLLPSRFDRLPADGGGFVLLGERDALDVARPVLGRPTPFVGRGAEVARMLDEGSRWFLRAEPGALFLVGEAGVGKSRLRQEALRRLALSVPRLAVWTCRGDPARAGDPLSMVTSMLRRILGVGGSSREADRAAITERARLHQIEPTPWVERFLGEIVGVPWEDGDAELFAARHDQLLMGDRMRRAFVALCEAETRARPLLVVVEDAQWGDLASIAFLSSALFALDRRPFGLWFVSRPEIPPRMREAIGVTRPHELGLASLSDAEARLVAANALGAPLEGSDVDAVVAHGARTPLLIEELARARAEGASERGTLEALSQARLGQLPARERSVLLAAATIGRTFWQGAVAALLPDARAESVAAALAELVRREWLVEHPSAKYHGEIELAFRDEAQLEAATALVPESERARAHAVVARWLERHGEPDAALIATHLRQAGRDAAAADYFGRAAQRAVIAGDYAAARDRAAEGLACDPPAEVRGRLDVLSSQAHRWLGDNAAALAHAEDAMAALSVDGRGASERWFEAAGEVVYAASRLRRLDRLARVGDALLATTHAAEATSAQVTAVARAATLLAHAHVFVRADPLYAWLEKVAPEVSAEPILAARIALARAWRAKTRSDWHGYKTQLVEALAGFELAGDARSATQARANAGHACLELGAYEEAITLLEPAATEAWDSRAKGIIGLVHNNLGMALARLGRLAEGEAKERIGVEAYREVGDERLEGASRIYLATILELAGRLDEAEHEAKRAALLVATVPPLYPIALAKVSDVVRRRGRSAEALRLADDAVQALAAAEQVEGDASSVHLSHAEALRLEGRAREAEDALGRARAELDRQAAAIPDPRARACFLERIPHHARILELASRTR